MGRNISCKGAFFTRRIGQKVRALEELNNYTPTFFEKLIHGDRRRELEEAVKKARNEDLEDYKNWETLNLLARRVLAGDTDADFNVIYEMNPLNDLIEYVSDFEFGTNNADEMHVEFTVNTGIVPTYSLSLKNRESFPERANKNSIL